MANINALKTQAAKLVVKGNYAKALEIYEKVKEMDPEEPGIYNLIGDVYLKRGEKESAISVFNQALELYKKLQYYPNAIAVCKKIIRTDKNQSNVYNDLANLYVERGFIGEAVINYLEYASRMRAEGNKKKEIEAYKKVIELGPSKVDIRERLVDLYIAEGEKEAAIEELERIEELLIQQGKQSELPEIEEKLAALKIGEMPSGKEKEAVEELGRHEVRQGFTMEDMIGEGVAVKEEEEEVVEEKTKEKEKVKKKEGVVEEEISLEKEIARLHEVTEIPQGEPVSVETLPPPEKSELQPAPTKWTDFEELAELCLSVNSKDEAVRYLYKAGQIYLDENNYEKAVKVFKKIIEIRPLELRPRQKLIELAIKRENREDASKWNLDLGECLYKKGAIEEAEKAFKRAVELAKDKDKVKKSIKEIKGIKKEAKKVKEAETPSISLGELLSEEGKKDVRFKIAEEEVAGEPVTFEDLLEEFKEGVLENIEDKDFDSHYDLGITYKEMGLLDEAILEFQKASKGEEIKLKSFEMLVDCLIEKGDLVEAEKMIKDAMTLKGHKEIEFLGLKYSLAQIYEKTNNNEKAAQLFREILKKDASFKEAASKLKELEERIKKKKLVHKEKIKLEKKEEAIPRITEVKKKGEKAKKVLKKAEVKREKKKEKPERMLEEKVKVKKKKRKISYI